MLKLSLRKKFILFFSPLVLCIFFFGTYSIQTFSSIRSQFVKLQQDTTPNAVAMLELKKLLLSLDSEVKEKRINRERLSNNIDRLKKILSSHPDHTNAVSDPIEKASHDTIHHAIRTMSISEYILNQTETGWQDSELSQVSELIQQELVDLGPILDEHLKIHLTELTKTENFVSKKYQHTLIIITIASVAVILFTIFILITFMRSVLGPVNILQEATRQIGKGNLQCDLTIESGDEFEFLANEFRKMAAQLAQYHDHLDHKVRERTKELLEANEELQKAQDQVHALSCKLLKVQENERQQISLDLHDNVAQELSSLKVASATLLAESAQDNISLQQEIRNWEKLLDRCIKKVRELSYNLRPPGLEQIGLCATISDYCRTFSQQTGIAVNFSKAGIDHLQLDYNYAITIYRLIQEALNNIKTHAHAKRAEIKLISSHPNIILRIDDDGQGFDLDKGYQRAQQNKRLGLLGMRERVRMLNGTFKMQSAPQEGTKIFIEFPTNSHDDEKENSNNR